MGKKRTSTVEIIRQLVASMVFTVEIDRIVNNGNGTYTLFTCNTYHLTPGFSQSVGGVSYLIDSVNSNISVTLSGSLILPSASTFNIIAPYYYHGTIIQTTNERTSVMDSSQKTPFVYLYEDFEERYFTKNEANDREADLKLFFLTQGDFKGWLTDDFHSLAIAQMRTLAENFIEIICERSKFIGLIDSYRIISHSKVKVRSTDAKGANLFNENLSGVEMNITLPITVESCEC